MGNNKLTRFDTVAVTAEQVACELRALSDQVAEMRDRLVLPPAPGSDEACAPCAEVPRALFERLDSVQRRQLAAIARIREGLGAINELF